jgi:hypothetical protein
MSALVQIFNSQDSWESKKPDVDQGHVIGHALVLVVKKDNGDLDVERIIGVNADSAEENAIAGDFIKKVEAKLAEIFEPVPEAKLWIPE